MSRIRYLLDENVDPALRTALLRRDAAIVVWRVGDPGAPLLGTQDPDILTWCEENGFILVTNNRTSMPRHLADYIETRGQVPGIVQIRPQMRTNEIVADLHLMWAASQLEEYRNLLIYLPLA